MEEKPGSPGEAYLKFTASMVMDFDKWHDGIGYDLDALKMCGESERESILAMLVGRLRSGSDEWRDVEALEFLGGSKAMDAIRAAMKRGSAEIRVRAAEALARMGEKEHLEEQILRALDLAGSFDGLSATLDAAAECPTPRVKAKLLETAVESADSTVRVNAAGLVLYLAGKAKEPFDWDHRPLFLRFGEEDRNERMAAYRELCRRIGVEPTLK